MKRLRFMSICIVFMSWKEIRGFLCRNLSRPWRDGDVVRLLPNQNETNELDYVIYGVLISIMSARYTKSIFEVDPIRNWHFL